MYDSNGNLKAGYTSERSFPYRLVHMYSGHVIREDLRTPNEAADLNADIKLSNLRWVPVQ